MEKLSLPTGDKRASIPVVKRRYETGILGLKPD